MCASCEELANAFRVAIAQGATVTLTVTPIAPQPSPVTADWQAINLTPMMRAIIAELKADVPTKAEVIAMRIGRNNTGSFRATLTDLVRFGIIRHIPRSGYFLFASDKTTHK